MSNSSKTVRYECSNDCTQAGCPGHELTITHHNSSDTVTIRVDAEDVCVLDEAPLDAIVNMEGAK